MNINAIRIAARQHVRRCSGIQARNSRSYAVVAPPSLPSEGKEGLPTTNVDPKVIRNQAGVQLLSPSLHKQVFGVQAFPPLDPKALAISQQHLKRNGLALKESPPLPMTEFTLPQLQGKDIEEHFFNLGLAHSAPYLDLAKQLATATLPKQPDNWAEVSGWVRYDKDGSYEPISNPPDDALVFDVETLYKVQPFAVMATAASAKHWFSWVSPWLLGETEDPEQLISLKGDRPTLIVGHNVGYDRARILEEYHIKRTGNRFMDTMSLHAAVTGLSSHQRAPWMKHKKNKKAALASKMAGTGGQDNGFTGETLAASPRWEDLSSMNSLADVAKLHCGIDMDKSARDWFGTDDKMDILNQFQDLMSYCASDVAITHKVFAAVLPAFLRACPNPVTFAGVLHMGNSFLPVDESWEHFIANAETLYQKLTIGVEEELYKLADQARRLIFTKGPDGKYVHETDPWLRQLDWTPKKARKTSDQLPAYVKSTETPERIAESLGIPVLSTGELEVPISTAAPNSSDSSSPTTECALSHSGKDVDNPSDTYVEDYSHSSGSAVPPSRLPTWYQRLFSPRLRQITRSGWDTIVPLLLKMTWNGRPVAYDRDHGWIYGIPPDEQGPVTAGVLVQSESVPTGHKAYMLKKSVTRSLFGAASAGQLEKGILASPYPITKEVCLAMPGSKKVAQDNLGLQTLKESILEIARDYHHLSQAEVDKDPWLSQLDWNRDVYASEGEAVPNEITRPDGPSGPSMLPCQESDEATQRDSKVAGCPSETVWPLWYWDMQRPRAGEDDINLSIRSKAAPLLLRLRWQGHELFHSRQHGWLYRVAKTDWMEQQSQVDESVNVVPPVKFTHSADMSFQEDFEHVYFKLPHKDGAESNVGSPLSKTFIPAFEDGVLSSEFPAAAKALEMNAQCSYWISARERVMNQLVVWETDGRKSGFPQDSTHDKHGMILPQVVTMGTVTRRAVESTWLAASNAKKNRLGSELKAMIRAPPGYSIVGADVDSEELWICCVMGDAQFGIHGATAIGWMTLEGTKSAGTDLHSKTASILGISRDKAKVFNYSRIYGAGVKHAMQLLLQANPKLSKDAANGLAKSLYASTKGLKQHVPTNVFERKFWYGGTESHVFNTLEAIAMAKDPRTPALGCGITTALAKDNLPATEKSKAGEDFMPSRINWVVQSSGVDYLHLLIVSMEYLCQRFGIDARFMISVHDEIRYLVKEEDNYRTALALQISNLWTRALFSHRLQMESLPQSCAWFSAVDLDHVLRKEVNMDCTTPSQPVPIPHGVSQDILETLSHTNNGSLFADGRSMSEERLLPRISYSDIQSTYVPSAIQYRSRDNYFLEAQNATTKRALSQVMDNKRHGFDWEVLSSLPQPPSSNSRSTKSRKPTSLAPAPVQNDQRAPIISSKRPSNSPPPSNSKMPPTPIAPFRLRRAPEGQY